MNKDELVRTVAKAEGITLVAAKSVIETTLITIMDGTSEGGVALKGFGTFKNVAKPARIGRNPSNGESINIAAKSVVKFVPGKDFKDYMSM